MTTLVVDASVALKWFIPEAGHEHAETLLDSKFSLLAPDLLWTEVANVIWKLRRREQLSIDQARGIVDQFDTMPVTLIESRTLLGTATSLAIETDRTVYDALYLAVALEHGCRMITADERFARSLQSHAVSKSVVVLGATN
jgi:predicted nucleic acid-binding protein